MPQPIIPKQFHYEKNRCCRNNESGVFKLSIDKNSVTNPTTTANNAEKII